MLKNTKIRIGALVVLLVMAFAAALASFSFAGKDDLDSDDNAVLDASNVVSYTNVDYIIKNSNATDVTVDTMYHIVELGSGPTSSGTLEEMCKVVATSGDDDFSQYVLNGNKSAILEEIMAKGKIDYKYYQASSIGNEDAAKLADVSRADLIYISRDAANDYSTSNDLSEELYNLLHNYATADYKPLIIDSPTKDSGGIGGDKVEAKKLISDYYAKSGAIYYTYGFDASGTIDAARVNKFFSGDISQSLYLGMSGYTKRNNWTQIYQKDSVNDTYSEAGKLAKILVITNNGGAGATPITDAFLTTKTSGAGPNTVTYLNSDDFAVKSTEVQADGTEADVYTPFENGLNFYKLNAVTGDESITFYTKGYSERYKGTAYRPEFVNVVKTGLASINADFSLSGYDMIILEPYCEINTNLSKQQFNKLLGAMYGNMHIIYATSLGNATTGGTPTTPGSLDDVNETNYKELFYSVATDSEIARTQNIMVTTKGQFSAITGGKSNAAGKKIADLIDASNWRGIGGPASSSNSFAVLEIQPAYPIDTEIEKQNNYTYYTKPSEVLNGPAAEELGYQKNEGVNQYKWYNEETASYEDQATAKKEYYAWEISKAKIAEALNMDASKIIVDHMSTEEFACNKSELLGKYDMIYIGGNTTALTPLTDRVSVNMMMGWGAGGQLSKVGNTAPYPCYLMYAHNGDAIKLDFAFLGSAGNKTASGKYPLGKAASDSQGGKTFVALNGNDISYNNLVALKKYVDAGMPVIFSNEAAAGYDIAKTNGYEQNSIDPDSNMFKFMDYCKEQDKSSIVMGVDVDKLDYVDNDGGRLGKTLTGTVEIFAHNEDPELEDTNTKINKAYVEGTKKPNVAVTQKPVQYSQYDASTKLVGRNLVFKYDVQNVKSYTANLYIDDDGNGKFASNEKMKSSTSGTLDYSLGSFKGGPVSWKLEIVAKDTANKTTVSFDTGICYIKPTNTGKQTVSVLQLYGSASNGERTFGAQGSMSLFFCTECQQALEPLSHNPVTTAGIRDLDDNYYASSDAGTSLAHKNAYWNGIYMGKHQHTFGIVKYDSGYVRMDQNGGTHKSGRDDWDWNLADELSDQFDFEIDIMSNDEFDELAQSIEDHFASATYEVKEENEAGELVVKNTVQGNYASMTAVEKAAVIEYEQGKLDEAEIALSRLQEGDLKDAEDALREHIETIRDAQTPGSYYYKEFDRLLTERRYHEFFSIWGGSSYYWGARNSIGVAVTTTYETLYQAYAKLKDKEYDLKQDVKTYSYYANYADNWIAGAYSAVVLGPEENFNNQDLNNPYGLATLKDYVANDGTVLLFHETLGRFTDAGPSKLTAALYEHFGNDPDHLVADGVRTREVHDFDQTQNVKVAITAPDGTVFQNIPTFSMDPGVKDYGIGYKLSKSQYYSSGEKGADNSTGTLRDDVGNLVPGTHQITISLTSKEGAEQNITDFTGYKITVSTNTNSATATITTGNSAVFSFDNHVIRQESYLVDGPQIYPEYKPKSSIYLPDQYFLTNLSYKENGYSTWVQDMKSVWNNFFCDYYYAPNLYSNTQFFAGEYPNGLANPYRYGDINWSEATKWGNSAGDNDASRVGTNRATQNNSGIITTYPFTLASDLHITGTHPSAYGLDIESDNLTVWYSLAGGTYGRGHSAVYAATPKDGKDNYFIYSNGNVYYCGAGHTKVTGQGKDNNDERRLYINILCNSVRNSVRQPAIEVFDYGTEENNIIVPGTDGYIYEIEDGTEYPEFTYRATVDKEAKVKTVNIYYELTPDNGEAYSMGDVYIANLPNTSVSLDDIASGNLVDIGKVLPKLKLENVYFTPYGGNYTYIVIEVTDSENNVTYQKIKIVRKPHLFDLT